MTVSEQLPIGFHGRPTTPAPEWFGLRVTHRALFDALQTEWLAPPEAVGGHLLLPMAFPPVADGMKDDSRHPIEIGLCIDPKHLPDLPMMVLRNDAWTKCPPRHAPDDVTAAVWPGPLPVSAIVEGWVATTEQRARLVGMAQQVSNLPLVPLRIRELGGEGPAMPRPPDRADLTGLTFPDGYDGIQGAAAMGLWALPRTDPWFDLLAASFTWNGERLSGSADALEAPWLANLPWRYGATHGGSFNAMLWNAALQILNSCTERNPQALLEALEDAVSRAGAESEVRRWSEATRAILRSEMLIDVGAAHDHPVATALQLVLARSDPDRFKTWATDEKEIPPAVWWSAAVLCGLSTGYRRLPRQFRGDELRRRYLALQPLRGDRLPLEALRWERGDGMVRFLAGDSTIAELHETARTTWYHADLDEPSIGDVAVREAVRLGWPCIRRELRLPTGKHCIHGDGRLSANGSSIAVEGDIRISLPSNASLSEVIDTESFRRCLATRGGDLAAYPPVEPGGDEGSWNRESFGPNVPKVPGLMYLDSYLSESAQADLMRRIDDGPWMNVLQRRVQHYGWEYDYKARTIVQSMRIGPLPSWAEDLAHRLESEGLLPWLADQVIVNEYIASQGISKHIDCVPCFEEAVAMISLVESWHMRFVHPPTGERVEHLLERGSLAIMTGDARYAWTHEIPSRKKEPGGFVRGRRLSLTFRKVRVM